MKTCVQILVAALRLSALGLDAVLAQDEAVVGPDLGVAEV